MKVLLINGSPHPKGNTSIALNEIAGELQNNDIETEIINIGTKEIRDELNKSYYDSFY